MIDTTWNLTDDMVFLPILSFFIQGWKHPAGGERKRDGGAGVNTLTWVPHVKCMAACHPQCEERLRLIRLAEQKA